MIRTPANKAIPNLTTNTVKVVDGVLYIGGNPPIALDSVKQCNLACAEDGTAEVVTVLPVIPTTCECPYVWEMTITTLPDLTEYNTDSTFPSVKLLEWGNPDGSTPTAVQVGTGIAALINADPSLPCTATVNGGTGELTLTGKSNGPIFKVYAVAGTVTYSVAGTSDSLTSNKLYKMFPLEHGKFGEIPPATFCGNYCVLTATIQECCSTASDAADVSMDKAIQGVEYGIQWAIPTTITDGSTADGITLHNLLNKYFTCLGADL